MKKRFNNYLPLFLLLLISGIAYTQSQPVQQLKLPEVVPASPDAAGIEKFGNIPVGYSTGIPDISIPMWTIKCGNINWPVALSYHAGGIKVDESASMAGLGWSINGIGVISRSRAGRPDEESSSEPNYNTVSPNDYLYLYDVLNGYADSEFDIFNFNFNGKSGKFIIAQDGSIFQIPQSNLKISYTSGLNSFTITDENGIVYLFDQKETTSSQNTPSESVPTYYTSSWYLSKVELPDKQNKIQFTYTSAGTTTENYASFSQTVGRKYVDMGGGVVSLNDVNSRSSSNHVVHVNALKITGVSFPNGSLTFTYDVLYRQDIVGYGGNMTNKLSSILVNNIINSAPVQLKKYIFYQSYFFYNPTATPNSAEHYRLRLDSLAESGMTNEPFPKKYKFQYNSIPIVPRQNYGQDIWGYNNGHWENPSLLQSQQISFNNGSATLSYNIGDANRNVDTNQMKAWMLTSITYPTGGKTDFIFEANVYNSDQTISSGDERETHVAGDQVAPQITTTTFTYPSTANSTDARVIVDMSKFNFPGVTQPSWVSVKDLTTGILIYVKTHANPDERVSFDEPVKMVLGHNYELKAYVYSNTSNAQLTASIKLRWFNYSNQPDIRKGSGLRIKEIKNFTASGILAGTEVFLYDTATTLTPFFLIQRTYSDVFFRTGMPTGNPEGCNFYLSPVCRIYNSGSVYAMSTALGSPMLYRRIQKLAVDGATGTINGKSEYIYDVFRDETYPVGGQYTLVPLITNDWENGFLLSEAHYKLNGGNYSIIKKTENSYGLYNYSWTNFLRVQPYYIREGCLGLGFSPSTFTADAFYYTLPTRSGSKRLIQQIATTADDNQNKIETVTTNYYLSNKYDFPTKTMVINSKGSQDSITFKYSPDFAATGNVYEKMEQRNIIAPVIEQKSYNNSTLLSMIKNNYRDWNSDGKIISLDSVQSSVFNNTLETRLKYYGYDIYNNLLSASKANDAVVSYIWDYQSSYPIASVNNASVSNIAYTSFETEGKGNWTFTGSTSIDPTVPTGIKYYTLGSSITKSGLSTSTTYIVSYWKKNGTVAVNGTTPVTGRTINGWTYYEHKVVNPSGGLITVSGTNGLIDELRLYPVNALMTTYTYAPLVGITSISDPNNRITYYEYDEMQRLVLIRDQDKNIIKKFAYNYNGQPDYPNIYYNAVKAGLYYKQGCTGCQGGSLVTYTVPAGLYLSTFSQADADSKADADVVANGQAYANANGTCSTPANATVSGSNANSVSFTFTFHNNCTGTNYNFSLSANHPTVSNLGSIQSNAPGTTYNVTFNPPSSSSQFTFRVNTTYTLHANSGTIYNVPVGTGGAIVNITP